MSFLPGMQESMDRVAFDRLALSQWHTPEWLAERMAKWIVRRGNDHEGRILEPAAGAGALVKPLFKLGARAEFVHVNELDPKWFERLRQDPDLAGTTVTNLDFLTADFSCFYDLTVMNPPYEEGKDGLFLTKAMDISERVVALVRTVALHGAGRYEQVWRRVVAKEFYLRGVAYLVARPDFGGDESAKADFVVVDLSRIPGLIVPTEVEWWR